MIRCEIIIVCLHLRLINPADRLINRDFMSLDALKSRLIHRIQDIDSEQLIQKLFSTIESHDGDIPDRVQLSQSDLMAIFKAEEDITEGRLILDEQADLQVKKWL